MKNLAPGRRLAAALVVGLFWLGPLAGARAQSKATYPWNAYLGGQVNVLSGGGNALLVRARAERSFETGYNRLAGDQLTRFSGLLGYEWLLSERWTGGAVAKLVVDPYDLRTFLPGAFLRHCGHIGSVQFRKRAVVEYVGRNQQQPDGLQVRLRFDLDRAFPVGKLTLVPRLAYDFQFDLVLQKKAYLGGAEPDTRFVDHGYLRAELGVGLTDRLTLVPYVLRQTDFIIAVEQRDAQGNVTVPDGPRNLRTPVVGFDVRYTFTGKKTDATRALPTFEGYQD